MVYASDDNDAFYLLKRFGLLYAFTLPYFAYMRIVPLDDFILYALSYTSFETRNEAGPLSC